MEFEDDKNIDLNRLEWECARQHQLFRKWALRWAGAVSIRDKLHERIKTRRSQCIEYIRTHYNDLGYNKEPKDAYIEAYYRTDGLYKELKKKFIKADAEVNMLYVAMRSFEHKRSMLEIEQKLYANDYWGVPYEVKEYEKKTQDEMEEAQHTEEDSPRLPKNKLVRR